MAAHDTGRLMEFIVLTKHELEKLQQQRLPSTADGVKQINPDTALMPPANKPIDDVLNRNNAVTSYEQQVLVDFVEKQPVDSVVQYTDIKHKLAVDGIPTRRAAGYYFRVLSTPAHKETDDAVYHETVRLAQALIHCGLPITAIRNAEIASQLQQSSSSSSSNKKFTKYNFDAWQRR